MKLIRYFSIMAIIVLSGCNLVEKISPGSSSTTEVVLLVAETSIFTETVELTSAPGDTSASGDQAAITSVNPPIPAGLSAIDPVTLMVHYSLTQAEGHLQLWLERFLDSACTQVDMGEEGTLPTGDKSGGSTIGGIIQVVDNATTDLSIVIPPVAVMNAQYIGVGLRLWSADESAILYEDMTYSICYAVKQIPLADLSASEIPTSDSHLTPTDGLVIGNGNITGVIYMDSNVNGARDAGELGIDSMEMRLANADCASAIRTLTSASGGRFEFDNVPEGRYCVVVRSTGTYRIVNVVSGHDSLVELPFVPSLPSPPTPPTATGYCGDGSVNADLGEQCDPPNLTDCTASCQNYTGYCGNGIVDPSLGEQCDPPNITDCTASCQNYRAICGNGIVDSGEQCDPPNITDCTASCQTYTAYCGNGIVDAGEQCDPPNVTDCTASCQTYTPHCGDGYVDTRAGEQCDPPNTVDCTASCQSYVGYCGNGIVDAGEQCDPPNIVDCTASCHRWP